MKTMIYGKHTDFVSKEEARAACDTPATLDTDGMIWNGEFYYDRDSKTEYWPVEEFEIDEDGEIVQGVELIGYISEVNY